MKSSLLSVISGKFSLRIRMLWSFFISLFLGIAISAKIPWPFSNYYLRLLFGIATFIIPFFVIFFLMTRDIIRYVLKLRAGLEIIALGDLQFRIPLVRKDELGAIAVNINAMAEQLEEQIHRERQMERAKLDLITGVSHDLRTPLTSIIGYLDLLKEKAYRDEEEQDRFVGNTYNKAAQLKLLIDDLFEYTRLTSQEVKLHKETINLHEMLNQMLVELEPISKENQVILKITGNSLIIEVDPEMIRRAIDNLLINAIKFSVKPGLIHVILTHDNELARITIENEGAPITKEQEERLFERFYKADDSRSPQMIQTGSGLGLSIARSITKLHGGQLEYKHFDGHFQFQIILPRNCQTPE